MFPAPRFAAPPSLFLADAGVPIAFDGAPADAQCLPFETSTTVLGAGGGRVGRGAVASLDRAVLLPRAQLGTLRRGSAVTVNGTTYRVRDLEEAVVDGQWSLLHLRVHTATDPDDA